MDVYGVYTIREVAEKLGVKIETVRMWIKQGRADAWRLGVYLFVDRENLRKLRLWWNRTGKKKARNWKGRDHD